jgi:hypothetical protein
MLDAFLAPFKQTIEYIKLAGPYFAILWDLAPIWGPIVLGYVMWRSWITYVQSDFIHNEDHVLLEINLPEEQQKSPLAMETALNALHQTGGESTFIDRWWEGSTRAWFSLELVSIEGEVHFFIWTREFFVDVVTSALYSQYPDIEIDEVRDYTNFLKYDQDEIDLWGCHFTTEEDDVFPIKTYIDYGLGKPQREEEKVDPITSALEFLGSCRQGEQVWIQILIRAHKGDFKDEAEEKMDEILKRDPDTKLPEQAGEEDAPSVSPELSEEEERIADAIKRGASKKAFDVGIRGLYIAKEDSFRSVNIPGLIGCFRQYDSETLNKFKPTGGLTGFDYPWQDYKEMRQNRKRKVLFDAYRRRSYFHPPHKRAPFVLNAEEIATMYHFPGQVAQTPTFHRLESKKAEPPSDLPSS